MQVLKVILATGERTRDLFKFSFILLITLPPSHSNQCFGKQWVLSGKVMKNKTETEDLEFTHLNFYPKVIFLTKQFINARIFHCKYFPKITIGELQLRISMVLPG
jgi:hypothetical protein